MKDLNALLREALKHQSKHKITIKVERPKVKDPVYDLYTNPQNWRTGEPVALVHRDRSTGRESFLGVFFSLHNDRAHARRLVPSHGTIKGAVRREVVVGDYWLHEQRALLEVEVSRRERKELEARFNELMAQYE
jgi:hypothetical protein